MIAYTPNPGFGWNPLRKFRNVPCPCECGKKAKHCVGKDEILPDYHVAGVKAYLIKLAALGVITLGKDFLGKDFR